MPNDPLILPQLKYDDPAEAITWLCRVFQFSEESRMVDGDGAILIAALRSPLGGRMMVGGRTSAATASPPQSLVEAFLAAPYSITVMVSDVDAHYARAVSEGAQIFQRPSDQPWGFRDYEAVDLEGRFWNFSRVIGSA